MVPRNNPTGNVFKRCLRWEIGQWLAAAFLVFVGVPPAAAVPLSSSPQQQQLTEASQIQQQATELAQKGKYREALPLAEQALALRKKLLGDQHPDSVASLQFLGELLTSQGEFAKAEALLQQAVATNQKVLGNLHPNYAGSLAALGRVNLQKNEPAR